MSKIQTQSLVELSQFRKTSLSDLDKYGNILQRFEQLQSQMELANGQKIDLPLASQ